MSYACPQPRASALLPTHTPSACLNAAVPWAQQDLLALDLESLAASLSLLPLHQLLRLGPDDAELLGEQWAGARAGGLQLPPPLLGATPPWYYVGVDTAAAAGAVAMAPGTAAAGQVPAAGTGPAASGAGAGAGGPASSSQPRLPPTVAAVAPGPAPAASGTAPAAAIAPPNTSAAATTQLKPGPPGGTPPPRPSDRTPPPPALPSPVAAPHGTLSATPRAVPHAADTTAAAAASGSSLGGGLDDDLLDSLLAGPARPPGLGDTALGRAAAAPPPVPLGPGRGPPAPYSLGGQSGGLGSSLKAGAAGAAGATPPGTMPYVGGSAPAAAGAAAKVAAADALLDSLLGLSSAPGPGAAGVGRGGPSAAPVSVPLLVVRPLAACHGPVMAPLCIAGVQHNAPEVRRTLTHDLLFVFCWQSDTLAP